MLRMLKRQPIERRRTVRTDPEHDAEIEKMRADIDAKMLRFSKTTENVAKESAALVRAIYESDG